MESLKFVSLFINIESISWLKQKGKIPKQEIKKMMRFFIAIKRSVKVIFLSVLNTF